MTNTQQFYGGLTPFYHLLFSNWNESIQRQAGMLDAVMRERWQKASTVLDVSCGIGTQSLGLSNMGYRVTASDLSKDAVERARQEAAIRNLSIEFSVSDMRQAFNHHQRQFDVVLSCDNSIPHLLSDQEILKTLLQLYNCTRPEGGCIISVRDYDKENLSKQDVKPYGIRKENGVRWLLWQVWDPHPPLYDVTIYVVEDHGKRACSVHKFKTTYYAIRIPKLMGLMQQAGFDDVCRLDGRFFQPIIIGTKKHHP